MQKLIKVYNVGRLDYLKCLNVQKHLVKQHLDNHEIAANSLILVEHSPVYTVGIRRNTYPSNYLDELKQKTKAQVVETDRGGLITFHGPGQLVAYPILNLKHFNPSLKWYVSQLEQIVINMCKVNFNLEAKRLCNTGYTGVWIGDSKVCAIGVHFKRFITYHGIAVNCNVDLNYFSHIVPCGITDKSVGSLTSLLKREITIDNVIPKLCDSFESLLSAKLVYESREDTLNLVNKSNS